MIKGDYYLGLDLGTNSVGWAVTDLEYNLLRAKGKDLWGVRLFDEAETAANRRSKRIARRRIERDKARKALLKEFFADEIEKVDPAFYMKMNESFFKLKDRSVENQQPYSLFNDFDFTDKEFHDKYKTIFHLRSYLIHSDKTFDVRLVFLAIYNMFSHRGHFLNATLDAEKNNTGFKNAYAEMIEVLEEHEFGIPSNIEVDAIEEILSDNKNSRSNHFEQLLALFNIIKKDKRNCAVIRLLAGLSINLKDIYDQELDKESDKKFGFRESNYEEVIEEVYNIVDEDYKNIIEKIKMVHDAGLLSKIMIGCEYLSDARVKIYDMHQNDLKQLKALLKKYNKGAYEKLFRTIESGTYSAYVGSVNSHGKIERRQGKERGKDVLYKSIEKAIKDIPDNDKDKIEIKAKIDAEIFLEKQLTNKNGVIPNQVHSRELRAILNNAEKYLPFLSEVDNKGYSIKEKIIQLFEFQIPYYVGPLGREFNGKKGYNCWAVRKESGRVFPWNFDEKIDKNASAEEFIKRMVRKCTYFNDENTLPKNSLIYEKFMVLNEINAIRINGCRLDTETKQAIYNDLFIKGKKVTSKKIKEYLVSINKMDNESEISGIDTEWSKTLTSIAKLKGVFNGKIENNKEIIEDIIFWSTIYSGDKKLIRSKIETVYPNILNENQLKKILGFRFTGWGNLSRHFLEGIMGKDKNGNAENSIIGFLWNEQVTLQELLSQNYTFRETIDEQFLGVEKPLSSWEIEDLDDFYLSPSVKRMTWQTMKIVEEIQRVLGKSPKRIFVEMTRSGGKKERTVSRKNKLISLYKSLGKEGKEFINEIDGKDENFFNRRKVYLYYLQMGKCMYSEEVIDFHKLLNDNLYDIEHIYPQHYIKDDSIENNLVLVKKELNAGKQDKPLTSEIQADRYTFWHMLKDKGFISSEKFTRLTRRNDSFTEDELTGFINRQIVETSQASKAITQILQQSMDENCKIVFSKAKLISEFRQKFDLPKSRIVNDLHHANDAYLNIVVGNAYYVKFTGNPYKFIKNAIKNQELNENKYHLSDFYKNDIYNKNEVAWRCGEKENPTIATVKKMINKLTPIITRKVEVEHGEYFKETLNSHLESKKGIYIGQKTHNSVLSNVEEYGGKTKIKIQGYALIEYKKGNDTIRMFKAIPWLIGNIKNIDEHKLIAYIIDDLQTEDVNTDIKDLRICKKFISKNSLIKMNGAYYYLGGKTGNRIEFKNAMQFKIPLDRIEYIHKLEKANAKNNYYEVDRLHNMVITNEKNIDLYKFIVEKLRIKPFCKSRKTSLVDIFNDLFDTFKTTDISNQCIIIERILRNIKNSDAINLGPIGGGSSQGKTFVMARIDKCTELKLIQQSVTGLFKSETDLLKI